MGHGQGQPGQAHRGRHRPGLRLGQGSNAIIGAALGSSLVDDSSLVQRAAVEGLELAVSSEDVADACARDKSDRAIDSRIALLYGDGRSGVRGLVTRQLAAVQKSPTTDYPPPGPAKDVVVKAAKDGIRKNWECLRGANFRRLDLSGLDLYRANLQEVDFRDADLSWSTSGRRTEP